MTPTLPEIMTSFAVALSTPMPPEATGDYMAGRVGMLSMLAALAGQEAERGPAARVWENGAIRAVLGEAAGRYDAAFDGALAKAAAEVDTDFTWSGLDAANAALRRLLIALHERVETAGDNDLDRRIIGLYAQMAHERRLDLGG
ncbi:hypothetical protein ACO2Q3_00365 [Caulobacter sp. KR2-114]|uniref:hypothetical protein n=1 Tax=Caulobacter sp. KR2-114 TaxID=3400912 RepID=UPI003C077AD3